MAEQSLSPSSTPAAATTDLEPSTTTSVVKLDDSPTPTAEETEPVDASTSPTAAPAHLENPPSTTSAAAKQDRDDPTTSIELIQVQDASTTRTVAVAEALGDVDVSTKLADEMADLNNDSAPPPPLAVAVEYEPTTAAIKDLDEATVQLLESVDTFYIQQKVHIWEAVAQGCCIQRANHYTIADQKQERIIMVVQEESEYWNRCCCKPLHSFYAKFSLADEEGNPVGSPVMTLEREGRDWCLVGPCPKPCVCCFACSEECTDNASFYAGDIPWDESKPGSTQGTRERTALLGESVQPLGGGRFRPAMHIMERGSSSESKDEANDQDNKDGVMKPFVALRGPTFLGGCSECFHDTRFRLRHVPSGWTGEEVENVQEFEYATIRKLHPRTLRGVLREVFTDADMYEVTFVDPSKVTAQQKANVLATLIHLDYMFFERDNDSFSCQRMGLKIVLCNIFIYGCICPCEVSIGIDSEFCVGFGGV